METLTESKETEMELKEIPIAFGDVIMVLTETTIPLKEERTMSRVTPIKL